MLSGFEFHIYTLTVYDNVPMIVVSFIERMTLKTQFKTTDM